MPVVLKLWEYRKRSYNRQYFYEYKINVFLPEMLCVVVLVTENGEFWRFADFALDIYAQVKSRTPEVRAAWKDRAIKLLLPQSRTPEVK